MNNNKNENWEYDFLQDIDNNNNQDRLQNLLHQRDLRNQALIDAGITRTAYLEGRLKEEETRAINAENREKAERYLLEYDLDASVQETEEYKTKKQKPKALASHQILMGALCDRTTPDFRGCSGFDRLLRVQSIMKIQIITLFPEMFTGVLQNSMLWKAQDRNVLQKCFFHNLHRNVRTVAIK